MPTAFVLMKCEEKDEHEIKKSFDKTDITMKFHSTIGHYDMIAKITSPSPEHLNEIIEKIHGNNKIHSTKVLLGIPQIAEVT